MCDRANLAHQLGFTHSGALSCSDVLRAAKYIGLTAKRSKTSQERLIVSPPPALAMMESGSSALRLVVLDQCDTSRVLYQEFSDDPARQGGGPIIVPIDAFTAEWTGELILITSRATLAAALTKFDFSWFVPSLVKYRRLSGEVLFISFMLQLFGMVSPLFFQVVMDKVLVHNGVTTLNVLVTGLMAVVLFESVLTALRDRKSSPCGHQVGKVKQGEQLTSAC